MHVLYYLWCVFYLLKGIELCAIHKYTHHTPCMFKISEASRAITFVTKIFRCESGNYYHLYFHANYHSAANSIKYYTNVYVFVCF